MFNQSKIVDNAIEQLVYASEDGKQVLTDTINSLKCIKEYVNSIEKENNELMNIAREVIDMYKELREKVFDDTMTLYSPMLKLYGINKELNLQELAEFIAKIEEENRYELKWQITDHELLKQTMSEPISYTEPKKSTYIMGSISSSLVKIGRAMDVDARLKTLRIGNPDLFVYAVCKDDVEKEIHKKFKNYRRNGEWFALNDEQLKGIVKEHNFELCSKLLV